MITTRDGRIPQWAGDQRKFNLTLFLPQILVLKLNLVSHGLKNEDLGYSMRTSPYYMLYLISSGDPLSNLTMKFASKEDAITYCQRMGINFRVDEPNPVKKFSKNYGSNFSWNKKTRVNTK
jgi:hypothetical protein